MISRKLRPILLIAAVVEFAFPAHAQLPEWVAEGIAQYDSQIHLFSVSFQRRLTYYKSLEDFRPHEQPVIRMEHGSLLVDGKRKRFSLHHRGKARLSPYDDSQTVETDFFQECITDGERMVRLVTVDLGDEPKQTAEYLDSHRDHFVAAQVCDPRTWLTAQGTPVAEFLASPDISSVSCQEVAVAGEPCVRIRVERTQSGFSELLINTKRGYRVQEQEDVREWMDGSRRLQLHMQRSVELAQDEEGIWYPQRVSLRILADDELACEHLTEYLEFQANVAFPLDTFSTLAPEGAHIVGDMTGGKTR